MKDTFFILMLCVLCFSLGFIVEKAISGEFSTNCKINNLSTGNNFDGLRFYNDTDWSGAVQYAQSLNSGQGDWVCVNVQDMSYERSLEVCKHECAHSAFSEILAENCEKDFNKCAKLLEEYKNGLE